MIGVLSEVTLDDLEGVLNALMALRLTPNRRNYRNGGPQQQTKDVRRHARRCGRFAEVTNVTVANGVSATVEIGMLIAMLDTTAATTLALGNGAQHGETLIVRQKRNRFLDLSDSRKKGVFGIEVEIVVGREKEHAVVWRQSADETPLRDSLRHALVDHVIQRADEAAVAGGQEALLDGAAVGVEQRQGGARRCLRQTVRECGEKESPVVGLLQQEAEEAEVRHTTLGESGEQRGDLGEREAVVTAAHGGGHALEATTHTACERRHGSARGVVGEGHGIRQVGDARATAEDAAAGSRAKVLEGSGIAQNEVLHALEQREQPVVAEQSGAGRGGVA